jgi:hypothetical protein
VPGGDENAFETLFNLFYDRIYTVALVLTKTFFLSEEWCRDIFRQQN